MMKKKGLLILILTLSSGLLLSQSAFPAVRTTVQNIREGLHPGFTRLVFDSEGVRPSQVGPATSEGILVRYEKLFLKIDPKRLGSDRDSAVAKVSLTEKNASIVFIKFRYPKTEVKSFFLDAEPAKKGGYRLVLDFYPPASPVKKSPAISSVKPAPKKQPDTVKKSVKAPFQERSKSEREESSVSTTSELEEPADSEESSESEGEESSASSVSESEASADNRVLSGEAAMIIRHTDVEGDAAKFDEYRDLSQPVTGELNIKYNKKDERFFEFNGVNIGAEDLSLYAAGGWFGKLRFDAGYDRIPHRFADNARTLYSGIGSTEMTLPDGLRAGLQGQDLDVVASRLNAVFNANAVSGDPTLSRDTGKLNIDLAAYDPLNIRAEFKRESRDGVKPFAGSFGLLNNDGMEELLEPVDYETTEIRLIGEYVKKSFLLNATYHLSMFENRINTLSWDNPLRLNDIVGGPSQGLMDLAPTNEYHNFSFSGSLMELPLKTRITATASRGLMSRDDDLVPFTVNTAVNSPPLPATNVNAHANTSLYHVTLTSRPTHFMNINGKFRLYEYDNDTEQILFPDGYVVTDSFLSSNPVKNLPTSYKKMTAGVNLGFDLSRKTRLNLGYTLEETDRNNREVSNQKDNIFLGSIDTKPWDWLDLKASYERRDREIGDYDYTVPLEGGGADTQEPLLRKYDEADKVGDAIQFQATLYPVSRLAVNGSLRYNKDDFENSRFGLLGAENYSASLDLDYAILDRANIHAFYTREKYEYLQKDRGLVEAVTADWLSRGQDVIDTFGGGVNATLISNKLNFDLSYSYSRVDGDIEFLTPAEQTADFPTVDETKFQMIKADLKYQIREGLSATLGYVWEKFDFDDFQNQGFTSIPTDLSDLYQGALLMGNLTESYEGNVLYLKLSYRF